MTDKKQKVAQFYSKSAELDDIGMGPGWRKYLSNFTECEIVLEGRRYWSVEHAFQAAKALCAGDEEFAREFECGGSVGPLSVNAKKMGGKSAFNKRGIVLDPKKWNRERDNVTFAALRARASCDDHFCKILQRTKELDLYLLHFERSAQKAYWGGAISKSSGEIVGVNRLGQMLMELRNEV